MDKCKNNPRCLFIAISIMLAVIFGLWGNTHAENLYLTKENADSDFTKAYTTHFEIPFAHINIDGDRSDWETITPVLVDGLGDVHRDVDFAGADIDKVYIAHDGIFLYVMISLDGPPVEDLNVQYGFEANYTSDPGGNEYGDRLAKAYFMDGRWKAGVHDRTSKSDNAIYPSSFVGVGEDYIEWKVFLADMGNLNGRYAWSYTHAFLWGDPDPDPELYPVSDSTDAVVRMIYKDW